MQRTVAILNNKGGVGKTTVTLGLASAAQAAGDRVLVVDLDPQASSSWVLGIEPGASNATVSTVLADPDPPVRDAVSPSAWGPGVDVVPSDGVLQEHEDAPIARLRAVLNEIEGDYNAVLLDCPPSLGALTRNALTASRHSLVVVEPSVLGLRGLGGVATAISDVWGTTNPELELTGVIANRVPAVSSEAARRLAELDQIVGRTTVWRPPLPQRVIVSQALSDRRPIHAYGARARDLTDCFDAYWATLRRTIRRTLREVDES